MIWRAQKAIWRSWKINSQMWLEQSIRLDETERVMSRLPFVPPSKLIIVTAVLAGALFDVSEQLSAFSTLETHKPLQIGFQKMAEGTRRLGDIDSGLATAESVTLADALAYSSAEAKEAKVL